MDDIFLFLLSRFLKSVEIIVQKSKISHLSEVFIYGKLLLKGEIL